MLTSRRPDGVWTWRAAGARQPKGVLEADLLPDGAAVGDVLRVEAEVSVDGIAVRQVLPTKAEKPPSTSRVEHLGGQRFTEGVTGPARLTRDSGERPTGRPGVAATAGGSAARTAAGAPVATPAALPARDRVIGAAAETGRSDRPACALAASTVTPGSPPLRPSGARSPNGWRTRESGGAAIGAGRGREQRR